MTTNSAPKTLAEMIAAGRYDTVDRSITEKNFPVEPERFIMVGRCEVIGRNTPWYRHTDPFRNERVMKEVGLRWAAIEELLAYGAESDAEQWYGGPIVALGSYCVVSPPYNHAGYPSLWYPDNKRCLGLETPGYGYWSYFYRFLVVHL